MNTRQIFQTSSNKRWNIFKWSGRLLLFISIISIPIVIFTLVRGITPGLPLLSSPADTLHHLINPTIPKGLSKKDQKKYKGFITLLAEKTKQHPLPQAPDPVIKDKVRAAFFVDWDPQSFASLQKNITKLNTVVPEWFFIDPITDTLQPKIDMDALALMKKNNVRVLPLINNTNAITGNGNFDGKILHRILHNPQKKEKLISDLLKYVTQYQLQGINIDFEEFNEKGDEPIIAFQQELYQAFHNRGLLVTQDVMPEDDDFNVKELSKYNDFIFLMAYDEHYGTSTPGPVCSQQWIEKALDETANEIPSEKIILALAGYGYDWPASTEATTITYQQALAGARQYQATIYFDNTTYNNNYQYTDGDGIKHQVYFADAATNFNTMRFADEYATAGTALWRLGSEDDRLWTFYGRNLSNAAMQIQPFDFSVFNHVNTPVASPDYIGDGEVLNVIATPQPGIISIQYDSTEKLVSEQKYLQLPTKYVIKKYGNVQHQVLLTFDDGPDPEYTPQILNILKREHVPAAFFVVGVQAEANLPLLKQIYKDGFEIGNHTFTHPNIAEVSGKRAVAEMESTRLLIEAATGHSTVLFRAPFNADAEPSKEVELKPIAISREKNYYTIGESIDPNDWVPGVQADSIYNRVIKQYEANPEKGIILLHDAGGNRQATVDALPRIIQYFKNRNIQFITVADLLKTTKAVIMPPVHNNLMATNAIIIGEWYYLQQGLNYAFWIAIILGLLRIFMLGIMVFLQKKKAPGLPMAATNSFPKVSIIVPAYNEEVNAIKTIENLLLQDYPSFCIEFVDDGSQDHTFENVSNAFKNHPKVNVHHKDNGGKASALNYGLLKSDADYVLCIDADTQLKHDALRQLMKYFLNTGSPNAMPVGAVAGNVKVGNQNTILTRWQNIEYITAQNFERRAFDLINGITVVPGAIGAFKKEAIFNAGGFTTDTLAEDCDLTIRIIKKGYRVVNCTEAIAITEAPETLSQFMKQRFRWSYGIMQSFWKNRDACFRPKYKGLGMVALPGILIFQIILPMIAPLADFMLLFSLIWNRHDAASLHKIGWYYLAFILVDMSVSLLAFSYEKEKKLQLLWLIPQRFIYRQLMYIILFKSIRKAIKGETQGWGQLKRTGNVKQVNQYSHS